MAPVKTSAQDVASLVARMPGLDQNGKVHGPTWAEAAAVYDEILAGGKEAVAKLIAMLPDHDQGENYKARYVLHGIVVYVARPGKEKERAILVDALLSPLGGPLSKTVQGIAVRELHQIAGPEAAAPLGKLLLDEDLWEDAAQALLAIGAGAVEQFRKALPEAKGKQLVTAVQALGVLRDAESLGGLKKAATSDDLMTRLTGLWALANVGDPGAADLLMQAASAKETHERQRAASFCLLLAERLAAAGRKSDAKAICTFLRESRTADEERYVRDAAQAALDALK